MPNNENYKKNPLIKLTFLLIECGWLQKKGFWEKENFRLLIDEIGIFLFRYQAEGWVRTRGLAFASMRQLETTRKLVFSDRSSLCLESGLFSAAPVPHRKIR
jgi:hypothetical protein